MGMRAGRRPTRSRGTARAERVLLLGALARLLISAGLGGARSAAGGLSGQVLAVHVGAGSLGWLALGILAMALGMLPSDGDGRPDDQVGYWLAWIAVAAVAAYVLVGANGPAGASAGTRPALLAVA